MNTQEVEQQETAKQSKAKKPSGVLVPEDFQNIVADLLKDISQDECDFLQDQCQKRMNEFYKEENKHEFSSAEMPE